MNIVDVHYNLSPDSFAAVQTQLIELDFLAFVRQSRVLLLRALQHFDQIECDALIVVIVSTLSKVSDVEQLVLSQLRELLLPRSTALAFAIASRTLCSIFDSSFLP